MTAGSLPFAHLIHYWLNKQFMCPHFITLGCPILFVILSIQVSLPWADCIHEKLAFRSTKKYNWIENLLLYLSRLKWRNVLCNHHGHNFFIKLYCRDSWLPHSRRHLSSTSKHKQMLSSKHANCSHKPFLIVEFYIIAM